MTYVLIHEVQRIADLLNELQELADQAMYRKQDLLLDDITRKAAEATEAAYLYAIQRIEDTV